MPCFGACYVERMTMGLELGHTSHSAVGGLEVEAQPLSSFNGQSIRCMPLKAATAPTVPDAGRSEVSLGALNSRESEGWMGETSTSQFYPLLFNPHTHTPVEYWAGCYSILNEYGTAIGLRIIIATAVLLECLIMHVCLSPRSKTVQTLTWWTGCDCRD
jgi:hypothetical protein